MSVRRPNFGASPHYKWWVVALLWCLCLLNYIDRSSIFVLFPPLQKEFSLTGTELGLISSVFLWVYSASSPFAGFLGDRFTRRSVILVSLATWSAITFATGLAQSTGTLLLFRALMGISEAAYFPAALSLLSDYHGRDTRSTAISVHQSGIYIGYMVGGAFTAVVAQSYGWRLPFYILGGIGLVMVFFFARVLHEPERGAAEEVRRSTGGPPPRARRAVETLRDLAFTPSAVALALVHFGVLSVAWVVFSWAPYFVHEKFHLSLAAAGVQSTVALQIPSVLGIMVGGVIGDRLMRRRVSGHMYTLVAGLLFGAPFIALLGWGAALPLALLGLGGFGFFKGFFDGNGPPAVYDVVHPGSRSFAYGIYNSIAGVSSGFAVLMVGMFKDDWGLGNLLASLAILYLVSAVILQIAIVRYLPADVEKLRTQMAGELTQEGVVP